jgi:hypothetical protein
MLAPLFFRTFHACESLTVGQLDSWTVGQLDSWTVGQLDSWTVKNNILELWNFGTLEL